MISIIIPVYNHHEMTQDCLEAVRENTQDYELILVDNGSDPPLPRDKGIFINGIGEIVEDDFRVIRNETNLGFPVAVNQGLRVAKGDVLCLLNNDVIVTTGWADRLLYHLGDFDIVAPMANYCAGLQQEVAIETYHDDVELNAAAVKWGATHDKELIEVNFTIGFCMVFKRSVWENVGDFDDSLWPCSGEEIDWCFRAREKGYRIAIARDAYVHHIGSQTFKIMEKDGLLKYNDVIYQNDRHLAKKWGHDFWSHQTGAFRAAMELPKSNGKIRLNLGCGLYKIEGLINIDQLESLHPDLVADATALPYEPGTVDEIYCGHLLEHLDREQGEAALRHWQSILKPGGSIMITVPDFDFLAKAYLDNPTAANLRNMNDLYIYSYIQESHHQYCYGPSLLKAVMTEAGFGEVERVTGGHPYFTSPMEDQITYRGVK